MGGQLKINYTYVRGIQEIKKAWKILQEGRVGIGKITHNLLEQSTKRKPVSLKQISEDSDINYSTLKTYYGYYVDIIRHITPGQQTKLHTPTLARVSKRLNRITGSGYDVDHTQKNEGNKHGRIPRENAHNSGSRLKQTRPKVPPKLIRKIYEEERERTKASIKMDKVLKHGYELVGFLRQYILTDSEVALFDDLTTAITLHIDKQKARNN